MAAADEEQEAADAPPAAWGYLECLFRDAAAPEAIYTAWRPFADAPAAACPNTNFLKGVAWSPDGSACLTASDDNTLRVFELPRDALQCQPEPPCDAPDAGAAAGSAWLPSAQVRTGETVYDYQWFPAMASGDPASCCFASTSRGQPLKLWDACSGALRASYRAYDAADEPTAAASLAFSPDGGQLWAGYAGCLRVFDVGRPGRDCSSIRTHRKRQEGSMPGIVSCLAFNAAEPELLAAGSYGRCIGLFDARAHEQLLLLEGHAGGVTQVAFSPDGNFLYSGARRDASLHCWDIRHTGQVLYSMQRPTAETNQRIGFSIEPCGRHLATGGCDGSVRVFDLRDGSLAACFIAAADTVNGVAFSPVLNLLATASGQRRYALLPDDDSDADEQQQLQPRQQQPQQRQQPRRQQQLQQPQQEQQEQQQQQQQEQQSAAGRKRRLASSGGGSGGAASLEMANWRPGGLCNSLRLWRLAAEWVAAEPAAADCAAAADAGAADEAGGLLAAEGAEHG